MTRLPALTESAPLLLADGSPYVAAPARRGWPLLVPLRTGGRHALPEPAPPVPAAEPAPEPAVEAAVEAAEPAPGNSPPHRWYWYVGNAVIGAVVLALMVALGAWSMWAMLNNVGGYLELHYPGQFPRPAAVPFWRGPAAAAVMAVDIGMVLWTVTDLWTRILRREIGWLRLGARLLGTTSIALNAVTGTDLITVLVHAAPAALYVGSVEAIAFLLARQRRRRTATTRELRGRIPVLRWLFGPRRWWSLRRMIVDGLSYAETMTQHGNRLRAEAGFTEAFGTKWRDHVPATVLVEYDLGELAALDPVELVTLARRRHAALSRERAAYDSARLATGEPGLAAPEPPARESAREPGREPRREPGRVGREPAREPRRESPSEPPGSEPSATVIPFGGRGTSEDSPGEPSREPAAGDDVVQLAPGEGPKGEPNRLAINAVLRGEYDSGEAAAKAFPGASKPTVNRWLRSLGWRQESTGT